jgi:pimeloyl-ACP methyl ester carboxylesterase
MNSATSAVLTIGAFLAVFGMGPCRVVHGEEPDPSEAVRPFLIRVADSDLEDLRVRLERTRWPDAIEGSGWENGVDLAWMKGLTEYWRSGYDWRAQERRLNQHPQYLTRIDGIDLHFLHVRSKYPDALPLVLIHGWPGSFVEFLEMIGPLTDPVAHGGKAEDAFHVVIPSLPGFGFSGKPREPGWSVSRMSAVVASLMARLGYDRYGAQGGDWGASVARWLGTYDSNHVVAIHLNFLPAGPPAEGDRWEGVTAAERERWESRQRELADHRAYAAIQGTRPQTLGFALNDSPVGLAAWILDKFWAWSDHGGDLETSFTRDELITNVMIYWVTQSGPSAARIYRERGFHDGERRAGRVPVGCALFPKEINVPPRQWVERQLDVVHWTEMPRGGHFAAMEEPELLVNDIRGFFGRYRKGGGKPSEAAGDHLTPARARPKHETP